MSRASPLAASLVLFGLFPTGAARAGSFALFQHGARATRQAAARARLGAGPVVESRLGPPARVPGVWRFVQLSRAA